MDVALRCRCGRVRGVAREVSPRGGLRVICYCKDCQAFAHFLERPDLLDSAGGTDIFQMPPAHVKITDGAAALRFTRLTPTGVYRWYTDCCRTPIGNAIPRVPIVGMIHSFMACESRDRVLGPPLCRIFEHSATAPLPSDAPPPPTLRVHARRMSTLLRWWLRGLARPSPFVSSP